MTIKEWAERPDILALDPIRITAGAPVGRGGIILPGDAAEKTETYQLRYLCDGCEVAAYLSLPRDYREKRYPVLIFNRGGNREFGRLIPELITRYALWGCIALGTQYRGNAGGTGREEFGGSDVNDAARLIDFAEEMPFARPGGVYMTGHSRGGMMTYLLCARYPERIRAAAVQAGVADCFDMYEMREQEMRDVFHDLIGGPPDMYPAEYAKRSAVQFAARIDVPLLILHGTEDWRVTLSSAVRVHELMDKYGKENRLIIYQGADHSLKGYPVKEDVLSWFTAHGFREGE